MVGWELALAGCTGKYVLGLGMVGYMVVLMEKYLCD